MDGKCSKCGGDMTGFTTIFCPICDVTSEPALTPGQRLLTDKQREALRDAGLVRTSKPTSHAFGSIRGGVTVKTGPVTSHTFGKAKQWPAAKQPPKKWTQQAAITACNSIENTLARAGGDWHVGLTGGTLYKTGMRKDVDFVIYPHVVSITNKPSLQDIRAAVTLVASALGFNPNSVVQTPHYKDGKLVFKIGSGIDIFVFGT